MKKADTHTFVSVYFHFTGAEHFLYTSLLFRDFEDLKDYRLIEDTDSLILLSGYNYEAGILEYHFA